MDKRTTAAPGVLLRILLAFALSAAWMACGLAQESRAPSVDDIVNKLMQPRLADDKLKSNAIAVEGRRSRAAQPASIDLAVNFEYASAKLTPDARIVLDNLGQALADPKLAASRFRIAGHTDARGSDAYNLTLSRQRARAVADYLKSEHHIDAKRLSVEGFGRSQLLDPAKPDSAINRRVQITNLGS